jgi:hypothetical protein
MPEANPSPKPCDRSSDGTEDSVWSHVPYRAVLGCLMYLITATCPDIRSAVSRAELKQIGLMSNVSSSICGERATLVCCAGLVTVGNADAFSDADYAGDVSIRSTSGVLAVYVQVVPLHGQANCNSR